MQQGQALELTRQVMASFKAAKIIKENMKQIVGIDFSNDGQLLFVADHQTLNVYTTANGQNYRKLFMKNHEIQQIAHTHHNSAVLVATKKNHLIVYWSIHENRVIKQFKGHSDSIMNLMINYKDDFFLTTSCDNTLKIWNLNSDYQECDFNLNVDSVSMSAYPVASFDPTGLTFGVAWSQQQKDKQVVRICLYSVQDCQSGHFASWQKDYNEIKVMRFSPSGHFMLLSTSDNIIVMLDALEGQEVRRFKDFANQSSIIECCFSPDSRYVLSGSQSGLVHVWGTNGAQVAKLSSHVQKVSCVKFSPKQALIASAGRNVTLWLPDIK